MLPWIVVSFGVFLIGLTKSGLGGGLGLIVVPMCAVALGYTPLGSEAALGLLLPLLIAGDLISIGQYRKIFQFSKVRPLLVPALAGIVLGSLLLWWIHNQQNQQLIASLMRLEIGLESIFLVGLHWWREFRGIQDKLMPEPARAIVMGGLTGVSTTLAHAAGPIVAGYLLPLRLDRRVFVGTMAVFFFIANTSKLPTYYAAGLFERIDWRLTAKLLPLVFLGACAGFWLVKRLTNQTYFRYVYAAVFLIGWYLIIESIVTLTRLA